ncbi:MAG: hypothetical protein CXR31_10160 [Geobacter sp.]|nr:MAG: hypothetical protein CXR31_10160 [Geobacter sp.]
MSLKKKFFETKPSGSSTSSKYDYQKNWSLAELLERHLTGSDYLFVFDFHDDLLVFDAEEDPQKVAFYQVKTKDTGKLWKLNDLIKSKTSKTTEPVLSIFGKLYLNKLNFPDNTLSLNFVSNAKFEIPLADNTQSTSVATICCDCLDNDVLAKINAKLVEEHALQDDPEFKGITFLRVSGLSSDDQVGHTKGKVSEFLEQLLPGKKYVVGAVYNTMIGEIRRKTNYSKNIASFEEMVQHKAIGRTEFKRLIDEIGLMANYDDLWGSIENRLNAEQAPLGMVRKIRECWVTYELQRMDKTNTTLNEISKIIREAVATHKATVDADSLLGVISDIEVEYSLKKKANFSIYTDYYIKAIILAAYYEN